MGSYYDVIKNPMDLSTMKSKLDAGMYKDRVEFAADFKLMIENAKTYNQPGQFAYNEAVALEGFFDQGIAFLLYSRLGFSCSHYTSLETDRGLNSGSCSPTSASTQLAQRRHNAPLHAAHLLIPLLCKLALHANHRLERGVEERHAEVEELGQVRDELLVDVLEHVLGVVVLLLRLGQLRHVLARLVGQLADFTPCSVVVKQLLVAFRNVFIDDGEVSIHLPEWVKNSCTEGLILHYHGISGYGLSL